MLAFKKQGHNVFFLNQHVDSIIKPYLEVNGVEVVEYTPKSANRWIRHLLNIRMLVMQCRKFEIDIVYSHLEPANFIAVIAQYFVRARIYICRHHINEAALFGFDKALYYRITYSLARKIIVVSQQAAMYIVEKEKIPAHKIIHINLAYDFSLYQIPNEQTVRTIRNTYACEILLLFIGRLNNFKRPDLSIEVLQQLVQSGFDAKLIILGSGDLQKNLEKITSANKLSDRVFFPGYVSNPLEFMRASNFLVHPSIIEASCVVVKEAALVQLPVIVCSGIGDFDSYIQQEVNGFSIDKDNFVVEALEVIKANKDNNEKLTKMTKKLEQDVYKRFSLDNLLERYDTLNGSK